MGFTHFDEKGKAIMVDVTEIPEAKELEEVTLMGRDGEEFISVETL